MTDPEGVILDFLSLRMEPRLVDGLGVVQARKILFQTSVRSLRRFFKGTWKSSPLEAVALKLTENKFQLQNEFTNNLYQRSVSIIISALDWLHLISLHGFIHSDLETVFWRPLRVRICKLCGCGWWDSKWGSVVSEATALPTVPQHQLSLVGFLSSLYHILLMRCNNLRHVWQV